MNIAQALKEKKRLAGEVSRLKSILRSENSHPSGQPFAYDTRQIHEQLKAAIADLVRIKAAIARANAEVYDSIFLMAELKGVAEDLRKLDSKEGTFREPNGYGERYQEIEYKAQIGRADADRLAAENEAHIRALQDKLDAFNVARAIEIAA